jgi:hypothetical protein
MIKVVFKKTIVGSGFRFRKGAEVELPNDRANEFLNAGFCDAVAEPPKKRAKKSVAKPKSKESR